ncbi:MAG: citrate/2-methylcitrate synthase [Candidatus Thermoplasmatota archaeon]|nr:citrate/2-methylcitrate synthase [Candidatus Thermoplasmatota archaeon]
MGDDDEILLELTKKHLNIGLRGIPVGTCRTSFVTPEQGVHYCGYPIKDLAELRAEDVVYLLFHKELPTLDQSEAFRRELSKRGTINPAVVDVLHTLPIEGHPMHWLSIGIQTLGMYCKEDDWRSNALNLVAQMPILMALIMRIREGRGANLEASQPELGLIKNFVNLLNLPGADHEIMSKILSTFFVLHMDHGGGNLSTFTGKAVASGHAGLHSSMVAAMNALSGPLHGRANQATLEFIKSIGTDNKEDVEKFVRAELMAKRPIFGFGHAVLRKEDPRATIQLKLAEELCPEDKNIKIVRTLNEIVPKILSEIPKITNPNANVDLVSGSLLNYIGFTKPEYYTTFFGWARTAGIGAQIIDERMVLREGKGVPIYRPKYIAEGQKLRRLD